MNTMEQRALAYLVGGYSIIPVGRDKKPLLSTWKEFQERYPTEEELHRWFELYPNANIAIVTGKISGITVLDIDTTGSNTVDYKVFPETYTVKTPSGGFHLIYQYDEKMKQTANTFEKYPHVDCRNDGGFIVASPSFCSYEKDGKKIEGFYTVEKHVEKAKFPIELFPNINNKKTKAFEFAKGIPAGNRNQSAASVIGHILARIHVDFWLDFGLVGLKEWNKRNTPPLDEVELEKIFRSIATREYSRRFYGRDK